MNRRYPQAVYLLRCGAPHAPDRCGVLLVRQPHLSSEACPRGYGFELPDTADSSASCFVR
jgi:hypothetical protein